MIHIRAKAHVSDEGILTLQVPDELRGEDVDVVLALSASQSYINDARFDTKNGSSIKPLDAIAGGWSGAPLVRATQGEFPERETLL